MNQAKFAEYLDYRGIEKSPVELNQKGRVSKTRPYPGKPSGVKQEPIEAQKHIECTQDNHVEVGQGILMSLKRRETRINFNVPVNLSSVEENLVDGHNFGDSFSTRIT